MTEFHFFASSVSTWQTTTGEMGLPALIKRMEKEGRTFNLYYVPLHHSKNYTIREFKPEVEGVIYLGAFDTKANAPSNPLSLN